MADQPGEASGQEKGEDPQGHESQAPQAPANQGIVFGLLGLGAVVCVCVVALVMAFLFSKVMQPPNISQTVNIPQPLAPAPATPAAQGNLASRDFNGDTRNLALPGDISRKSTYEPKPRQVAIARGSGYPLPQAGDSMTSSAEAILAAHLGVSKVRFLIRGADPGKAGVKTMLPFPARAYNPKAPVVEQSQATFGAVPKGNNSPPVELSDLPDVEYQLPSVGGGGLRVEVLKLIKTSKTENYDAVKGLQFLVAQLQVTNTTSKDRVLKIEGMEAREAGGVSYGADADLVGGGESAKTIEGGSTVELTVAFQVPDSVEMKAIAIDVPNSKPILIPLNKK